MADLAWCRVLPPRIHFLKRLWNSCGPLAPRTRTMCRTTSPLQPRPDNRQLSRFRISQKTTAPWLPPRVDRASATLPREPGRTATGWSLASGFALHKAASFAGVQKLLRVDKSEHLDQFRHHAGPPCLVAGPETRAIITVKILVEEYALPS